MEVTVNGASLILVRGDITEAHTEAIVNAANSALRGGGGVDGAIHRAGGPRIMEECRRIGGCPTGQAVVTTAGDLHASHVIHTVGPVYRGGTKGEDGLLRSAYMESLNKASEYGLRSISFPAVSAGVYGYPLREAARIALRSVIDYLKERNDLQMVQFVLFDQNTYEAFVGELQTIIAKEENNGVLL